MSTDLTPTNLTFPAPSEPLRVAAPAREALSSKEECLVLSPVRWQTYEMLTEDLGRQHLRLTYDQGKLEIMAPSFRHEDCSVLLGQLIRVLAQEFKLPFKSARTTTFRAPAAQRGLEADDCFYLQSLSRILGKRAIDLAIDPPPDLALEVEISPSSLDRMSVYAALRIPEVWRCDEQTIRVYILRENGQYEQVTESPTFPGVPLATLVTFLQQGLSMDETSLMESFRTWVRKEVLPGRTPPEST